MNIETKTVSGVTILLFDLTSCRIIGRKVAFSRTKTLWNLKNTKNKVPKSDIEYIAMISVVFDGKSTRFLVIFAHLRKTPYLAQTRKSVNLVDFPSNSPEIIEINSISDFGTLFFMFFSFQRLSLRVLRSVHSIFLHEVRDRRKM